MPKDKSAKPEKIIPSSSKLTLKDRISGVVDSTEDKEGLKKAIFDLVQRVLYPDQFCPECDDRLFLSGSEYNCLNCGYKRPANIRPNFNQATNISQTTQQPEPSGTRPEADGKAREVVEKVIAQSQQNMSDTPKASSSARGEEIRKLAEKLGDSTVQPTKEDENILKGADKNVRDINWVG